MNSPCNDPQVKTAIKVAQKILFQLNAKQDIRLKWNNAFTDGAFEVNADKDGSLTISGNGEGLRCGLYSLLEQYGVRYFNPAEGIIIPSEASPLDTKFIGMHQPDFTYRGMHICGPGHFDENVAFWMSFNRMNRKLTAFGELPLVGKRLWELGLQPDTTVHSYSVLISDNKYFAEHPEFFALVGGTRITHSQGGQLCLSNPQLQEAFVREILALNRNYPETKIIGICPNDGYGWCECSKCEALKTVNDRKKKTVNGPIAYFVSKICAQVAKGDPAIKLGHYSYSNFADFVELLPEMPSNLVISFTQFHCYKHPMNSPDCPENSSQFKRLQQIIDRRGQVYLYDYYSHRGGQMMAPFWDTISEDFKTYHKSAVSGFMSEIPVATAVEHNSFWPVYYVTVKLLYDSSLTAEQLLDDWCVRRYGKASRIMSEYFKTLAMSLKNSPSCFTKKSLEHRRMFTPTVQAELNSLLESAVKLENQPEFAARLDKEYQLFKYWLNSYHEQTKYQGMSKIKTLPFESLHNGKNRQFQKLYFVRSSDQLPDSKNDSHVAVYSNDTKIGFYLQLNESEMDKRKQAKGDGVNAIFDDDNVEIFLADGKNAQIVYHFLINPEGKMAAAECQGSRWNWSWVSEAKIEVNKTPEYWDVCFVLDKEKIRANSDFKFTIIRNRHSGGQWDILGTPAGGAYFNSENYITGE